MIRTTKHNIKDITNINKLNYIDSLFDEYKLCLEYYIDIILDNKLPLKKNLSSKELPTYNIEHSKFKRIIYKHASEIIRSQAKKANNRRFKNYQRVYNYFKNHHPNHSFSKKKYSDLKLNPVYITKYFSKPNINNISITLTSELYDTEQGNHFDNFIRLSLPFFNNRKTRALKINIPLKHHSHSNKFKDNSWKLKNSIQLNQISGKIYICLFWEKDIEYKQKGHSIGIDIGYKKLLALSNGSVLGRDMEKIYEKISRKQQGSKSFKKALIERDNLINYYANQLNLSNINKIIIENLKSVKKNSKGKINKSFNNKLQRWSYNKANDKLKRICEEQGISMEKVSPEYTSQTCSLCGYCDKNNRNKELFNCNNCGYENDADINAAININNKGVYSLLATENQ